MRPKYQHGLYGGVALLSCAALILQIALTRLYSALYGNHLAFLAVSLSLFGIGLGGVLVYLFPSLAPAGALLRRLAQVSAVGSIAAIVAVVVVTRAKPPEALDAAGLLRHAMLYAVSSTPFIAIGIAVAASLERAAADASRLYLVDLLGAAAGGALSIAALSFGAPRAGLIVAVLIAMAGACFALGSRAEPGSAERPAGLSFALVFVAGTLSVLAGDIGAPWLKLSSLRWAKLGKVEFQKWNALALVTVDKPERGIAWMRMDGSAATAILAHKTTPPLHPDEMAYVLSKDRGPVLVIGAGGGRDIRAAMRAGQKDIWAAEINSVIVRDVMRDKYRAYSGELFDKPEVRVEIADGRSFVKSSSRAYRVIVISLVDTWAASSVGALALTESSLYTVEAFRDFIEHLHPEGTLLVNRWDGEFDRLLALGVAGLRAAGATSPAQHLFACGAERSTALLLKRTPLTRDEVRMLRAHCKRNKFTEVFGPDAPSTELRARIASMPSVDSAAPDHPTDLSPPTDDRPFFFYTVPTRLLPRALANHRQLTDQNQGLLVLVGLFIASAAVAAVSFFGPLVFARRANGAQEAAPARRLGPLAFFGAIGTGFVLVEIALVQHLGLFLGHPVYALSTALVSLLAWTGIGSLLTHSIDGSRAPLAAARRAEALVAILAVYAVGLGSVLSVAMSLPLWARVGVTLVLSAPLGVLMGAQAPLAIKIVAARGGRSLVSWCWGLNGFASVVATAGATLLAMQAGFSVLLLAGGACYLIAVITIPRHFGPSGGPSLAHHPPVTACR